MAEKISFDFFASPDLFPSEGSIKQLVIERIGHRNELVGMQLKIIFLGTEKNKHGDALHKMEATVVDPQQCVELQHLMASEVPEIEIDQIGFESEEDRNEDYAENMDKYFDGHSEYKGKRTEPGWDELGQDWNPENNF